MRGHRPEDLAESFAMWSDDNVVRYIGGRAFTREEVWARLLRYAGHWHWMGFGYWVLEEKATGRFAGEVGFAEVKRGIELLPEPVPEIGWTLARWAHGQGFATEAVGAVVDWGKARFGPGRRTVCVIHPENVPSLRVAEKCGYREFARTAYKGGVSVLLSRAD